MRFPPPRMQRPCSHSTARGEAHGVSWVARVKAKHCSHRTVVRYSSKDGQKVEERLTLSRAVKQMQLEREEGNLQGLSLRDLRQRLDLLVRWLTLACVGQRWHYAVQHLPRPCTEVGPLD